MKVDSKEFIFFALAPTGDGVSGGDRIFIELAREWSKKYRLKIYTTIEGVRMINKNNLQGKYLEIINISDRLSKYFSVKYFQKIFLGIKLGLGLKIIDPKNTILYSTSDFWMDLFPAIICKFRYPTAKLICAWYQTAPNPLKGYVERVRIGKVYRFRSFFYWFVQFVSKPLIKKYADRIIVNNVEEKKQFPRELEEGKVVVLIGGVPLEDIKKYLSKNKKLVKIKIYDAVFQGRFHPQKGVVELIDIWAKVVNKIPKARLAMIGDGPLMKEVQKKIKEKKMERNVKLFGYLFDGEKKYKIFAQSKIVVHPAFYDSGGMASAEAMAFGLPCVGFDLLAYQSYYPRGMFKVKIGDLDAYADAIVSLLRDKNFRDNLGEDACNMVFKDWSWNKRSWELMRNLKVS